MADICKNRMVIPWHCLPCLATQSFVKKIDSNHFTVHTASLGFLFRLSVLMIFHTFPSRRWHPGEVRCWCFVEVLDSKVWPRLAIRATCTMRYALYGVGKQETQLAQEWLARKSRNDHKINAEFISNRLPALANTTKK